MQRLLSFPHEPGDASASAEEIFQALCDQNVEIVLTAHPTEVNRRTVIRKHRRIDENLASLDRPELLWWEKKAIEDSVKSQIQSLWWTDEIRRSKPTPMKEALQGLDIVESSLWRAVPAFLRRLDVELEATPGIAKRLPPNVSPVRFSSWCGGDRDGNPNVTPEVTKKVAIASHLRGARLVSAEMRSLASFTTVSAQKATPELLALLPPPPPASSQSESTTTASHRRRPYADLFNHLIERLNSTVAMLEDGRLKPTQAEFSGPTPVLLSGKELCKVLMVMHDSLTKVGLSAIANGGLTDLVRQVRCFGLCLLPLDIRNESVRHAEALDAVTQYLGLKGSYLEWDEDTRLAWLLKELATEKRPLLPRCESYSELGPMFGTSVSDTLGTFDMIAEMPEESVGAYVISMAHSPSDILAVKLLQREAGVKKPMRVVPLFETLADLEASSEVMCSLWSIPWVAEDIKGKQEVNFRLLSFFFPRFFAMLLLLLLLTATCNTSSWWLLLFLPRSCSATATPPKTQAGSQQRGSSTRLKRGSWRQLKRTASNFLCSMGRAGQFLGVAIPQPFVPFVHSHPVP
jgi:phosphoenolpyruvate carboxylase